MTYEVDDLTPEWLREEVKTGVSIFKYLSFLQSESVKFSLKLPLFYSSLFLDHNSSGRIQGWRDYCC
jgi:hypothetical protein